jgi:hypothetical protein
MLVVRGSDVVWCTAVEWNGEARAASRLKHAEPGKRRDNMDWIAPDFEKICLDSEISSYANAEL